MAPVHTSKILGLIYAAFLPKAAIATPSHCLNIQSHASFSMSMTTNTYDGSESLYYYDIYYSMSDSEDVQSSSTATTSKRRSSCLTASEDEDDELNDGTTGHIVDRLVLLNTVNIVPLLSVYKYLLCVALLIYALCVRAWVCV